MCIREVLNHRKNGLPLLVARVMKSIEASVIS